MTHTSLLSYPKKQTYLSIIRLYPPLHESQAINTTIQEDKQTARKTIRHTSFFLSTSFCSLKTYLGIVRLHPPFHVNVDHFFNLPLPEILQLPVVVVVGEERKV